MKCFLLWWFGGNALFFLVALIAYFVNGDDD